MTVKAIMFGWIIGATCLVGCPKPAVSPAQLAVISANTAIEAVVAEYKAESLGCIDNAATRDDATKCMSNIDSKFAPIFKAYDDFKNATDQVVAFCNLKDSISALLGINIPDGYDLCKVSGVNNING